ncbi:transcriptional regulator [Haloferula helveola]|uniref:Transcriptional regulator n=1 Tax=Haloferula helveola TaxID=490095 RepID=A0ABN6GY10_9BACT|nr:transcriptional regulator [Haloferula helveola]
MNASIAETDFACRYPMAARVFELFDFLPNAYFYAKDRDHRYIGVSESVLREVFGLKEMGDLVGKTDHDFQPPALAEAYHAEDRRAMETRQRTPSEVWLVPQVKGPARWYVSTKIPLIGDDDRIEGIAGVMYRIDTPEAELSHFQEMVPVIRHIEEHFREPVNMSSMAAKVGLSSTQFNVRFRAILHMSPTEFLLTVRLQHVRRALVATKKAITQIAIECGFYDQSHLTRKFRRSFGITPAQYRRRFR